MEIKGYQIERMIGRGGMATVYLAVQETLGRRIALKVMNPEFTRDPLLSRRFLEEGPITARLNDPQIVTVYDTGVDDEQYYLAMEYLPGGTLKQLIRQGLPLERALNIAEQLGRGLAYAHSRSVVHRDIKPHNILFRESGEPVITDFGIAKAGAGASQLTLPGTTFGSPNYMSPEQAKGLPLDARSDLYSFGVIVYEMLTGELPYRGNDSFELAQQHITAPLPRLPDHLAPLQPSLDKLLAKDPEQRYTIAEQFIEELRDARQQITADPNTLPTPRPAVDDGSDRTRPLPATPTPRPAAAASATPPPTAGRSRSGLLVATALIVLGLGAGGYFYLQQAPESPLRTVRAPDDNPPTSTAPVPSTTDRTSAAATPAAEVSESTPPAAEPEPVETPGDTTIVDFAPKPADAAPPTPPAEPPVTVSAANYLAEARALFEADQPDASLDVIEQGLADYSGDAELLALRDRIGARRALSQARARQAAGDLDGALVRVEDGLELTPEDTDLQTLQLSLHTALEQRRRFDQAAQHLARSRELLAGGDPQAARREVDRGLQLLPEDRGLLTLRERIDAARLDQLRQQALDAYRQDELDRSRELIEQGLELAPTDAELLALGDSIDRRERRAAALAEVRDLRDAGRLEAARDAIENALTEHPEDRELLALRDAIDAALQPEEPPPPDPDQAARNLVAMIERLGLGEVRRILQERLPPQSNTDDAREPPTVGPPIAGPPTAEPVEDMTAAMPQQLPDDTTTDETAVGDETAASDDSQLADETADDEEPGEDTDIVEQLLAEAETYMDELKLTTPRGANAYENYRDVLALEPDNAAARRGLDAIVSRYLRWARGNRNNEQFDRSLGNIDKGLLVQPGHRELLQLREEVLTLQEAARQPVVTTPPPPPEPPADPCAVDRGSDECWCQTFGLRCN